jgi:hypothetical protein
MANLWFSVGNSGTSNAERGSRGAHSDREKNILVPRKSPPLASGGAISATGSDEIAVRMIVVGIVQGFLFCAHLVQPL